MNQPARAIVEYRRTDRYFDFVIAQDPDNLNARFVSAIIDVRIATLQAQAHLEDSGLAACNEATASLTYVLGKNPGGFGARSLLTRAYVIQGEALFASSRWSEAIPAFANGIAALEEVPSSDRQDDQSRLLLAVAHESRGVAYLQDNQPRLADADADAAFKALSSMSNPKNPQVAEWTARAHALRGDVASYEHRYAYAIDELKAAVASFPNFPEALRSLGIAYVGQAQEFIKTKQIDRVQSNFEAALSSFEKIPAASSGDVPKWIVNTYLFSSSVYLVEKQSAAAKEACAHAIAIARENPAMPGLLSDAEGQCNSLMK
jgi:tetratricopeptide (TPR) repeat protein